MKKQVLLFIQSLLNSYSVLFFSQNNMLAVLLLAASFFNPAAGAAGLASVCLALFAIRILGFADDHAAIGLYSFNSLLTGIGFGTFYQFNGAFCIWLAAASFLTLMLSVTLIASFGKKGVPVLSMPFVLVFWVVLLAANGYSQLELLPKESYMLNELSVQEQTVPRQLFEAVNTLEFSYYIRLFLRAISAVLFQDSVMAGAVISLGILIHSRISFSLLVVGFISACLFNHFTNIYPEGTGHYHLGVNFMMTSMALGSFFLIPSFRSYVWAISSVPVSYLLIGALSTFFGNFQLPVFSLPFCVINILALYFLSLRVRPGKLQLTIYQHYSPEANLYQFLNGQERLPGLAYKRLALPFMGTWTVSQGYDGEITHKEEWSKALDFVITDEEQHTYRSPGSNAEHFYCFNKPVLACADGMVEAVVSHIEDNKIGEVNTAQNWGNTIVLKHDEGLYTKVSHLKQHSVKVAPGDVVKQGDILALCGNSGRSPEPHLHFQAQATPFIGSKTTEYPFALFKAENNGTAELHSFKVPEQDTQVSTPTMSFPVKQAFTFQPGYEATVTNGAVTETWKVYTDMQNQTYFYSEESGATAYFNNTGSSFYFTSYFGAQGSLLYKFYLAAFKVVFSDDESIVTHDLYPLNLPGMHFNLWLHDLISPFYRFIKRSYTSYCRSDLYVNTVHAKGYNEFAGRRKQLMEATITISGMGIDSIDIKQQKTQMKLSWQAEGSY